MVDVDGLRDALPILRFVTNQFVGWVERSATHHFKMIKL